MLESKPGILVVSFILAIFMFLNANKVLEEFNLFGEDANKNTVTIENVPVEIYYDNENYYVTGAQKHVQVDLSGPPSRLKQLQATENFKVSLDLRDYEIGEYDVSYEVDGLPENVTASVLPERSNVAIQNLVEQTFEVQAEVNESRMSSNYTIDSISTDPEVVTVRGGEDDMARIQYVRAMISGTDKITEKMSENAEISVFDGQYNKLDVIVDPGKVEVTIDVDENKKEVPVYLDIVGNVKNGYQLDDATLEEDYITLYGSQEALDEIAEVYVELDLKDLKESGSVDTNLKLPSNISKTEPTTIKAEVKISKK